MAEVTDISEELGRRQLRAKFSRLMGLAQEQEARIVADPMPYLIAAERTVARLLRAIDNADHHLTGSGEVSLTPSNDPPTPPVAHETLLQHRIDRARAGLREAVAQTTDWRTPKDEQKQP